MNVVKRRKLWYLISAIIIIPGLIMMIAQGFNLGIDFTGGNMMQLQFNEPVETSLVREITSQHTTQTPSIQQGENDVFIIRTAAMSEAENIALLDDLRAKIGTLTILSNESIGAVVGGELTRNAQIALILALLLMMVYIAFRFKFNFAIAAILPLLHDVLVVISLVTILRIEISSSFIAAILTIVGYSINSTIVIFDRIRENSSKYKKEDFGDLIDNSIKQTLTRSINTNVAVLLLLIALFIFGGTSTKDFILILIVGVTAGAYSSIFLAGSFLFEITNIREKLSANKKLKSSSEAKPAKTR